jgi:hypothetical protein
MDMLSILHPNDCSGLSIDTLGFLVAASIVMPLVALFVGWF